MNKIIDRVNRLIEIMNRENIDGFFIMREANVRYMSGFSDSDSYLFITKEKNYFLTDGRYTELAEKECPDYEVIKCYAPSNTLTDNIKVLAEKHKLNRIGFEKDTVTYGIYENLSNKVSNIELVSTSGLIEELRYIKDDEEVANIREAARIADNAFSQILDFIKPGMTENDIALELEYYMRKGGASGTAFETILISGTKTSLPHGKPDNKVVETGDFITMDYGALYNGYRSDMTRTIVVGEATKKQGEIYELVKKSQEIALNSIKAGVSAKVPDDKVREILKDYIEYYYPGMGHGVGRELHEQPFISNRTDRFFKKNCVVTVEPGLYIPGWGGVRIEDTIVVTDDGYEILTKSPKELIVL